jgi:predicted nucleic acid-binding protein
MVEASRLRALYGLRTPDAIHAATALRSSADGILSNDKRLSRLTAEGLQLWLFDDLTVDSPGK